MKGKSKEWMKTRVLSSNEFHSKWGGEVHLPSGKPKNIKIKSNQREEVAFSCQEFTSGSRRRREMDSKLLLTVSVSTS